MENDYKELFQKILPKITYNHPKPYGINYDIKYENVMISQGVISIRVDYCRNTPHNKVTVVKKVLNDVLRYEVKVIQKYINLNDKEVIIECITKEEAV